MGNPKLFALQFTYMEEDLAIKYRIINSIIELFLIKDVLWWKTFENCPLLKNCMCVCPTVAEDN